MEKFQSDNIFPMLSDAIEFVEKNKHKGCVCPCCNKLVKVWRKKPISTAILSLKKLIVLYQNEQKFYHLDDFTAIKKDRNFNQLINWNLVEQMPNDDKEKRASGYYKPTDKAIEWYLNKITIPKYVYTDNNEIVGYSEEKINFNDALGHKFNFEELIDENK